MNILFVGDVVGRPGRAVLREHLANIISENEILQSFLVNSAQELSLRY